MAQEKILFEPLVTAYISGLLSRYGIAKDEPEVAHPEGLRLSLTFKCDLVPVDLHFTVTGDNLLTVSARKGKACGEYKYYEYDEYPGDSELVSKVLLAAYTAYFCEGDRDGRLDDGYFGHELALTDCTVPETAGTFGAPTFTLSGRYSKMFMITCEVDTARGATFALNTPGGTEFYRSRFPWRLDCYGQLVDELAAAVTLYYLYEGEYEIIDIESVDGQTEFGVKVSALKDGVLTKFDFVREGDRLYCGRIEQAGKSYGVDIPTDRVPARATLARIVGKPLSDTERIEALERQVADIQARMSKLDS